MNHQRLGGTKSVVVYHGDSCLGEVEVFPATRNRPFFRFPGNEIRISHLSPPSERCLPHSVLHTVAPFSVKCKIQAKSPALALAPADLTHSCPLYLLYLSCFHQLRSAVVMLGAEELHLVALPTRLDKCLPCFWCFSAPAGLYSPCLGMLNLRCLAIVFDLDETLIVANTMKSFEDRIDAVSNRIDAEDDAVRVSGMSAELKRYLEDKALLKQYIETDTVLSDNGRLLTVQNEEVPPLTSNHTPFVRPIIRLQEKNVILTRINPEIRDTSVLVRLRPAWEDLRNYLTAKGRKRFEVYVCTMAERDYALEMWRLLDPEANLISSSQLLDRIVCVKSGSRKSLDNVFQGGSCHPKMSMVIDDRLKVWEDRDQPRVHVVPAFAPYYAPQAETANIVPVLCVARNVACNVRGAFFKEFDENLLRRAFELHYEEEMQDFPLPPDTSDYLMAEDINSTINGNRDMPISEGISGAETEKRLNQPVNVTEDEQAQHKVEPVQQKLEPAQQKVEPPQQKVDNSCSTDDINQVSISNKNYSNEDGSGRSTVSITVLLEIGRKCGCKIEFKSVTSSIKDSQYAIEVLFGNEKIGLGMGRTKKEAQIQASVNALRYLANRYKEFTTCDHGLIVSDLDENSLKENNGFLDEEVSDASVVYPKKVDMVDTNSVPEPVPLDDAERLAALVSGIKELLSMNEGHNLVFREQPPTSVTLCKGEYYSQLETTGQILGKGICKSREGAKLQAADDALRSLKVVGDHIKHLHSPRLPQVGSRKRSREEFAGQ